MLFIYNLGAWFEFMLFAISTMYKFTVSILKEIISETDKYSDILSSKTHVFEDKKTKYQSV